jgi:membrane associated rhomboid family serine protease
VILLSYALQSLLLSDRQVLALALTPAELLRGDWPPLITALFIHSGWVHAGMNAVGALAFGAPAARYLGLGPKGAFGFFLLFLACGVLSSLGFALLHRHGLEPMAGASGAVSGLFGASTRLIEDRRRPSPLATRSVITTAAGWTVVNAVMGALNIAPGMGEVHIAWETHIVGYFAGLLLIGPFAALFGQPPPAEDEQSQEEDRDGSIQSGG